MSEKTGNTVGKIVGQSPAAQESAQAANQVLHADMSFWERLAAMEAARAEAELEASRQTGDLVVRLAKGVWKEIINAPADLTELAFELGRQGAIDELNMSAAYTGADSSEQVRALENLELDTDAFRLEMNDPVEQAGATAYAFAPTPKALVSLPLVFIRKSRKLLPKKVPTPTPDKPKPPPGGKVKGRSKEERKKSEKFYRSKAERRKALLRDAKDPNSGLTKEQREYILKYNGKKVPEGLEVSHEVPLYTKKTVAGKKELDVSGNMKTQSKKVHRDRHKECGDQFHDYPR